MLMIKAVIFDVDGTLIDSEPIHVAAWDATLQRFGHHLSEASETLRSTMAGKKPLVIATELIAEFGLSVPPAEFVQEKTDLFLGLYQTKVHPMPGVIDAIKRLNRSGYVLGIGTAMGKQNLLRVLHALDVTDFFAATATGDDVLNGKPHPETYLTVAGKLGVPPGQCVVIEDSESGIASAKAAGCLCIALVTPHAIKQDTSKADKVITSFDVVDEEFIEQLATPRFYKS